MALLNEIYKIDLSNIISSSTMFYTDYIGQTVFSAQWKARDNNAILAFAGYGDACISASTLRVDGDLLISSGWNDGFAVKRINNNGSITHLWYEYQPFSSTSLVLDTARGKAYSGGPAYNGIVEYDYSAYKNGGAGPGIKGRTLTVAANNLPFDKPGRNYWNGLEFSGNYLYILGVNTTGLTTAMRWNVVTEQSDNLAVINYRNGGRSGGSIYYSADTDRIYYRWVNDGEMWVVTNASKAQDDPISPARAFNIRFNDVGLGLHCYQAMSAESTENPNHVFVGGVHLFAELDITPCLNESTPGLPIRLSGISSSSWYDYNLWSNFEFITPDPVYKGDLIIMLSCQGYVEAHGWWDKEYNMPVVARQVENWHNSEDGLRYDYGGERALATTTDGTKYWVYTGYANSDGYSFHVFPESYGNVLEPHAEIVFGTFGLSNGGPVGQVKIDSLTDGMYIPSGCTVNYYLSSNNGVSWESFDPSGAHTFSTAGNQVRLKIVMDGFPYKMPHFWKIGFLNISLTERIPLHNKVRRSIRRLAGYKTPQ
ncbi:hypothetical protein [Acinetobacter sp.]|uniref:hypothetical protein n=1 Tax=Acinetobacter sp. TaxID=472 RepID=UPI003D08FE91